MDKPYKEEIEELTSLFKEELGELKDQLDKTGIDTENALLAGYMENDNGVESGVLFTREGMLIRFTATTERICVEKVEKEDVKEEFPQVTALDNMIR